MNPFKALQRFLELFFSNKPETQAPAPASKPKPANQVTPMTICASSYPLAASVL
ncbi:MAG: hypothetical protein J0J10_00960 [Bosea sp.]|uniref:hypothetical protein n=1 Tax=Bosea sp. (in: a-proteobacteria) TaxID=1871050 RepID=UPI001ACD5091|nr:hypothetical protein [Bosea sp. (in: a-proteobacteria)]MBN9467316.1 hypothetical protein [Bosea sp. (in: a-proteobacteria)]